MGWVILFSGARHMIPKHKAISFKFLYPPIEILIKFYAIYILIIPFCLI